MQYVRRHNCVKLWIKRIVGDNHIENDLLVINVGTERSRKKIFLK